MAGGPSVTELCRAASLPTALRTALREPWDRLFAQVEAGGLVSMHKDLCQHKGNEEEKGLSLSLVYSVK